MKQFAVTLMERTGSFAYTEAYLHRIEEQARDEIQRLGGNSKLSGILDLLRGEYHDHVL